MKDDWPALDTTDRFCIAVAVARRRGSTWVKRYDNVVSVGAGRRLRGPSDELVDEICLCFLVCRKWTDSRHRPQKIPAFIAARPLLRGLRLHVLIPTDVSLFDAGQPHAQDLSDGLTSRLDGKLQEFGATCCLVHNAQIVQERYLLSCFHVFSATLARPPQPGWDCEADDGSFIGPLADTAKATGSAALDAALVRVTNPAIDDIALWGLTPTRRATDFDLESLPQCGGLFVLGRRVAPAADGQPPSVRTQPIAATFSKLITAPTVYDYGPGGRFVFKDTIEYKAAVRKGDSGSALMDERGMLYGMHFYGRGEFGYALAAPRLFDPRMFQLDIEI